MSKKHDTVVGKVISTNDDGTANVRWTYPETTTSGYSSPSQCPICGMWHGPICPSVKAIEYYPDGSIKRIEYR